MNTDLLETMRDFCGAPVTAKHTPGPWLVGPEYENRSSRSVWHGSFAGTAHSVCRFVKTDEDARLIAAAPQLLAALVQILGAAQEHDASTGFFRPVCPYALADICRAAIAKAEGRA